LIRWQQSLQSLTTMPKPSALTLISSMATQALLTDLLAAFKQAHPTQPPVRLESVGGVDAARRVGAGEVFDLVALASNAIDALIGSGQLAADGRLDLARSGVAVAVPAGAPRPDIGSEAALKAAVLAAPTVGCSTGPSGVQLHRLFERWGIAEQIRPRLVTAPPGVPVGSLVARGEVALGFQQMSELMGMPGVDLLGPMPEAVQIHTTFSVAATAACEQPAAAQALLGFLASPCTATHKRRHGMEPVQPVAD
jgi:molybdate transport system substrate-binding protein